MDKKQRVSRAYSEGPGKDRVHFLPAGPAAAFHSLVLTQLSESPTASQVCSCLQTQGQASQGICQSRQVDNINQQTPFSIAF